MAIEYSLKLDGALLQDAIGDALETAGFVRSEQDDEVWIAPGVVATLSGAEDRFGRYREAFGFTPATNALFTVDKLDLYETGMHNMVMTVARVMAALPDDLVLIANHDTPLLVRRGGSVTLSSLDDWWESDLSPPLVAHFPKPYRFELIPVL